MRGLVAFIQEAILTEAVKVTSKSKVSNNSNTKVIKFKDNNGKINAKELYNELYDMNAKHNVDDICIYADDYENQDEYVFFDYDGMDDNSLKLLYAGHNPFARSGSLKSIVEDLGNASHDIFIDADGMVDKYSMISLSLSKANTMANMYIH